MSPEIEIFDALVRVGSQSVIALLGLAIVGLLWAPFGALTCMIVAKTKGRDQSKYAIAGALHSFMLLLPWIYLLLLMYNISVHKLIVGLTYVVLSLSSLGLIALYVSFAYEFLVPLLDQEAMRVSQSSLPTHIIGNTATWGATAFIIYYYVQSLWRLIRYVARPHADSANAFLGIYGPRNPYRGPFAMVWLSLIVFPMLWVFTALLYLG